MSEEETRPLIEKYTNIIHEFGVGSTEALDFKFQHRNKDAFQRRAKTLDKLKIELDAKQAEIQKHVDDT